jgi:uncharacterized protein
MINTIKIFKSIFTIQDDPKLVAKGFALGSFIGMLPIPGFQLLVSLTIAALFKINKKAACLAVFNTNLVTGAFVFSFNYWLGKNLLGVRPAFMIGDQIDYNFIHVIFKAGSDVFLSLLVGGILTGLFTATIVYYLLLRIFSTRLQKVE